MNPVNSPAATGGSGSDFEFKVGAACLTLLLTRGAPLFLENATLCAAHFQTSYLGWKTDDLLLEATNELGIIRKAAIQVKRTFVLSERNEDCVKVLQRAFADFRNKTLFDSNRDVIGLVTSSLSGQLTRGIRTLLDCARASTGSADMVQRLRMPGYLGKPTYNFYITVLKILEKLPELPPAEEEIWHFLTRFNVVALDVDIECGITETLMRSLLKVTACDGSPASATATWNELHTLSATRTGTATSFTIPKLPEHLRQRHGQANEIRIGVSRLLEDTRIVVDGLRTSIGGKVEIPRREHLGQLFQLIEDNSLTFVSGEAGSGKSVMAKMAFQLATQGAVGFAFRAESLAGTHINEVFARFGLTLEGLREQTAIHGRKILWVESLERLMEKDAEQRAAFLDLLRAIMKDPSWKIIVTCRDYHAENVKSAFFGETGIRYASLFIPELDDAEMAEVMAKFPHLEHPLSSNALRQMLRKPFLLDKAAALQWPSTEPLPQHERAFRAKVWREVVRQVGDGVATGLPKLRGDAMIEIALRRAKAMEPFVSGDGLDSRAVHGLVRDSLLAATAIGDDRFAPAHDVFEDWALAEWLDVEFERAGRQLEALFFKIENHPALRRAFRKWLTELLDVSQDSNDVLVISSIRNNSIPQHWRDDILVGVLLSTGASDFLGRNATLLNADGAKLLRQVIHLLRVACKVAIPRRLFGIEEAGDVFLPHGSGWNGSAGLMLATQAQFGENDFPFFLGFMEDWVQLRRWGPGYPKGSKAIAKMALEWLPKVKPWRSSIRDCRERLAKILLTIPLAAEPDLSQLAMLAMTDNDKYHDHKEVLELMFNHYFADAFIREMPDLAFTVAEYTLGLHLPLEQVLAPTSRDDMNLWSKAFGLGFRHQIGDYPASAYHGPFFKLLSYHPQRGLNFILKFVNRACEAYSHPLNQKRGLRGPASLSIRLPDGTMQTQYGDAVLWVLYRDFSTGPNALKSALMALERWLLDKAKRTESDLYDTLIHVLRQSNNIAVTSIVASIATAYPDQAGVVGLTVLSCKNFFTFDLERSVHESMNPRQINYNMWPDIEKQLYDEERAESSRLPHRQNHLEYMAIMLQWSPIRDQIWALIDAYKTELPEVSKQDEKTKIWRFRLHQMDTRNFVKVGETKEGNVLIQASKPAPEIQEVIDANKPHRNAWDAAMGLVMWGRTVFDRKTNSGVDHGQWKEKLAEAHAQKASTGEFSDEFQISIAAAGPAYIAAVCIRDHWRELTDAEQQWCVEVTCDSVEAEADDTDQLKFAGLNPLAASRPSAFMLPALFAKKHAQSIQARLLPALAKAITHSSEEVVKYAIQGVGLFLWNTDRSLALTCVQTIVQGATEQHRFWHERRKLPFGDKPSEDQFATNLKKRLRDFVERRRAANEEAILQLDLTQMPGRQLAEQLFTILVEQGADKLSREFFKKCASTLAARWHADSKQRHSRSNDPNDVQELNSDLEHLFVDSLAQFVIQLPPQEAMAISEPIYTVATRFPEKSAEFVKWLVIRQGDRVPASTLWSLWQRFADEFCASALPSTINNKRSDSSKLLRELFLGVNWMDAKDWKPLLGEEHRVRNLFDKLPPSQASFEAYVYFLSKIGTPSLPDALISVAEKLPPQSAALLTETSIFYFEGILTRLIYGGNRRIRVESRLQQSVMIILDTLVTAGSSIAYKLRDDFLTPFRNL